MNKWFAIFLTCATVTAVSLPVAAQTFPFYVYMDANSPTNHFVPSGWMGDFGDLQLKVDHAENCKAGGTCIQIIYSAKKTQGADWAGIYWQDPANNWGDRDGGFDLTGASKLTFWARGEKGGEKIDEFRSGGIPGEYFDSDVAYMGPVVLTAEWKKYEIELTGKDLKSIKGGFAFSARAGDNKGGAVFYIDDIRYE